MLIGSGILYVCFADSTLQKWNAHSTRSIDKELQLLSEELKVENNKKQPLDGNEKNANLKS